MDRDIPTIYLIPVTLGDSPVDRVLPSYNLEVIHRVSYFIVENVRSARRFLKACDRSIDIDSLHFSELNQHTAPEQIPALLGPAEEGHDIGVIS